MMHIAHLYLCQCVGLYLYRNFLEEKSLKQDRHNFKILSVYLNFFFQKQVIKFHFHRLWTRWPGSLDPPIPWFNPCLCHRRGARSSVGSRSRDLSPGVSPTPSRMEEGQRSTCVSHTSIHRSMAQLENSKCSGKMPSNLPGQQTLP